MMHIWIKARIINLIVPQGQIDFEDLPGVGRSYKELFFLASFMFTFLWKNILSETGAILTGASFLIVFPVLCP